MSTGLGGDAFALLWTGNEVVGLDAAGPAPRNADPEAPVAERGPTSVTVPGGVAGWAELVEEHGSLGLDTLLSDAIAAAETGFAVGVVTAADWAQAEAPPELGRPPVLGERVRLPELGATLRRIAEDGPDAFYRGDTARAVASSTWLDEEDLAAYAPRWVEPLALDYRGLTVHELGPPTQGVAALEGLALLALGEPTLAAQVGCVRLALEDALAHVRDGADVRGLLEPGALARRRSQTAHPVAGPGGGTVYLCAADRRRAVSFIQSLYGDFGSGVVAPGTGVVLQNRGACFAVGGRVEPGRRPYHTLIPGLLTLDGKLYGAFGVMGGFLQPQAHVQLVSALVDGGLDPQAALDRPRFRVEGGDVLLEEGLWERAGELEALGLRPVASRDGPRFGGGQAILVEGDVLVGGSDGRKDGYAAGC
jgi:gamma-glutamyltranspeptidase/glutathione hydrolase